MFSGSPIQDRDISQIGSYRRNPVIADLFHRMRFMERRGSGLHRIISETERLPGYQDSMRPVFFSDQSSFKVIIYNVNYDENDTNSTENSIENGNQNEVLAKSKQSNSTENSIEKPLSELQTAILKALEEVPSRTLEEVGRVIGCPKTTVRYHVQKLQKDGKVRHEGSTKAGKWVVF